MSQSITNSVIKSTESKATTNASVAGPTSSAGPSVAGPTSSAGPSVAGPAGSAECAIHEDEIAKIKKDLEKKGEAELQALFKEKGINSSFIGGLSNGAVTEQSLMSIMQRGFDEFKEKTGQTMSYSDMRDLYG